VWKWLKAVKDNYTDIKSRRKLMNESNSYSKGIAYLLSIEPNHEELKSISELKEETEQVLDMTIYTDNDRNDACKVCGWTDIIMSNSSNHRRKIKEIVEGVEKIGQNTRATCIAACHFDFTLSVNKLSHSDNPSEHYNEESSNIQIILSLFMLFNNLHPEKPHKPVNKNDLDFYKQLINKVFKDGFKMKNEYFNWVLTLFNNHKATINGFEKIDFMDRIASF